MRPRRLLQFVLLAQLACLPDPDDLASHASQQGGGTGGTGGTAGTGGTGGTGIVRPPDGGPVPDGPAGAAPGRAAACAEFAAVTANKAFKCSPLYYQSRFGSEQVYKTRLETNCNNIGDLPGVQWPRRPFPACAAAIQAQTCADWSDDIDVPLCHAPGLGADGANCGSPFQCQSGFCVSPVAGGCGKCTVLPGTGAKCYDGENCAPSLACNAALNCVVPRLKDQPCGPDAPCRFTLLCRAGKCIDRGGPGAPCTEDIECNTFGSLLCNEARGICVAATVSPAMCRLNLDGSHLVCASSAICKADGICQPVALDGAGCDDKNGPRCLWPARCTAARCTLPQPQRACAP